MNRLSPSVLRLRKVLLGIPLSETTFEKRRFTPGRLEAQTHLENIGRTFVSGYHAALETESIDQLQAALDSAHFELRGFAFEGAAMGLMLLDRLMVWRQGRFERFLSGPGDAHAYMVHVGAGWACARLPWLRLRLNSAIGALDPLLRWLAVDGFGFHEGYFSWARAGERNEVPRGIRGYARRAFDQGLGRSLWFVKCADTTRVSRTIAQFDESRRADLWSGIGLACAYAGAFTETDLTGLPDAASQYTTELAQGAAFAAKARLRAGNLVPHTERACQVLCGVSAREAAEITDSALRHLPHDGVEPAFEVWRRRVQREFTAVRR